MREEMKQRQCMNLKRWREQRKNLPTKRDRKNEKLMQTLDGRLIRYCQLRGITPDVTPLYVQCTMPSGVRLQIYKQPTFLMTTIFYGVADRPGHKNPFRLLYIDKRGANYLFQKLAEHIHAMESGKELPSVEKSDV